MNEINTQRKEPDNICANRKRTPADAVDVFFLSGGNEQPLCKKGYEKLLREVEKGIASGYVDEDAALRRLGGVCE